MTWSSSQSQTPVGIQRRHLHDCRWIWPRPFPKVCRHMSAYVGINLSQFSFSLDLFGRSASLRVLCFEHGDARITEPQPSLEHIGHDLDILIEGRQGEYSEYWWGPAPIQTSLFKPYHIIKKHVFWVFCNPTPSEQGALLLPVLWERPWCTLAAIFLQYPGTAFTQIRILTLQCVFLILHIARSTKEQKFSVRSQASYDI